MPEIEAKYEGNGKTYVSKGQNYSDRFESEKKGKHSPKAKIKRVSPHLFNFMEELQQESYYDEGGFKKFRSAFSCAEAQALAGILESLKKEVANPDFSKIRFSRPTSEGKIILWEPCKNCSVWLESAEGWGPDKKYKLSAGALQKLLQK